MGSLIHSGEVGNIGLNQLKEQRTLIAEKWGRLGLLDGLKGHVKDNIAQLYENQASWMLRESTDTIGSNGSFETVAFPIIRRVFSKLLANDIVSVQSLSLPIGKLFFMNPHISTVNTSPNGAYSNAANLAASAGTQFDQISLYDAYYGNTDFYGVNNGNYDRSRGKSTINTVTLSGVGVAAPVYTGVEKYVSAIVPGISFTQQGKLISAEGEVVDTESFLASLQVYFTGSTFSGSSTAGGTVTVNSGNTTALPFRIKSQVYGVALANYGGQGGANAVQTGSPNGNVIIEIDLTTPGASGYAALTPGVASAITFMAQYKSYAHLEENSEMAEVTFQLEEVTVSVTTRKMRAQWTPELATDVAAFQNIDAEAELTALLSEQMAAEIDREILRDLRAGAAWSLRWDYNGLRNQSTTYYGTQKDWNQTLMTKINQISAQIHKSTLRGGASWIVVSPEISAVLDDLEYFHVSNASPEEDKYNMGIEKIGSLNARYTVYRDPYAPANTLLIGHKGSSILESGYIYAPYVPMQLTPTMYNPADFKPIKGIMCRYAKKMVNNKFYGKLLVDGLTVFNDPLF